MMEERQAEPPKLVPKPAATANTFQPKPAQQAPPKPAGPGPAAPASNTGWPQGLTPVGPPMGAGAAPPPAPAGGGGGLFGPSPGAAKASSLFGDDPTPKQA